MAKSIFLMSSESGAGKSIVALGVFAALQDHFKKIAYYKPIATLDSTTGKDPYVQLLQQQFSLPDTSVAIGARQDDMSETDFFAHIIAVYRQLEAKHDFVLIEGSDYTGDNPSTDFMLNINIAKNIGCQVMLVEKSRSDDQLLRAISSAIHAILDEDLSILSLIVNRVNIAQEAPFKTAIAREFGDSIASVSCIPEAPKLINPTVKEVAQKLNATVFYGHDQMMRQVGDYTIAAKMVGAFLNSIKQKQDLLVITPGDREDLILSCLLADQSAHFPKFAGMLLTTNEQPTGIIKDVILGLPVSFPILVTDKNTFDAATLLHNAQYHLFDASEQKITLAIDHVRSNLNEKQLIEVLTKARSEYLTPPMFTYNLIECAKHDKKHIVLPEGEDIRVLQAAEELLKRDIVTLTSLGNPAQIQLLASENHINLAGAAFIDPAKSEQLQDYANQYFQLRQHKNVNMTIALDRMQDPCYFGTMMVYTGACDGMVSGAMHTTGETIRPALEIIKTTSDCHRVSSVFLICLKDRVLIYGDCAVNPDPDAQTLAEIAVFSARSAKQFGIEPRIAMLSYSSGTSGVGASVDKVREATEIVQAQYPDLLIEGPIQYDAAVDMSVAQKKLPNSLVAGRATVLIFPDLNSGNNTYKAVQRETGAIAIGPVLQGLNKPVNDLSRGCTVKDIINTVVITAIQATGHGL